MKRRYLVAVVAVGALLGGCGEPVGSEPGAGGSQALGPTTAAPAQVDPLALIGSWTVAEVDEGAGDILRLAGPDTAGLLLFARCGVLTGEWRADENGLFVAGVPASTIADDVKGCEPGPQPTPVWLRRAAAFRVERDSRVLLDDQGGPVARLLPGAKPTPRPNLLPSWTEPPVITDEVRRAFAPAAALPAALTAVSRDALLGRWVVADDGRSRPTTPYVEFRADGEWRGSDGCNGQGGRWVAGPSGALLATSGPSTLIGCDNVSVGLWLATRRAGLDGDVLVLLDAEGKEMGRLHRDR
ncbi:MAG TPA: hypothetical protein VFX60_11335 [Micromonospora sp.]|nr:hypothetical protein [Micromonospora sp.]